MKFSVLVPIYNVGEFLPETLKSLDGQTFRDFQAVLVNDGSTDICPGLCDDYKKLHPETVVVHQPNGGLVSARRAGIKAAEGDFIVFVDGDDRLVPQALEKINKAIEAADADMVIYNAEVFDENGKAPFFEHVLPAGIVADKNVIYDKLFFEYSLNSMCLKATKRSLYDADRDYSDFYRCSVAEDMLQSVPLIKNAKNISYLDEMLYEYRTSSGMTHKCNPDYYWSNRKINLEIRRALAGENVPDLEKKAAFHILIAAYAGTTQMKFADKFDKSVLEGIRNDEEFKKAWSLVWGSEYASRFNKKQKLILKLLYGKNYGAIKVLLSLKG